ncbi:MAG: hypothetical protein WCD11_20955 [Solirubrobacteraceae bacterium]
MFHHTHIKRSLAAGIAIGVAALPAAAQAEIYGTASSGAQPSAAISAPAHHVGPSTQAAFNWGDVGIGAGGAIVLVGAGAASAVAMRRRRVIGVA